MWRPGLLLLLLATTPLVAQDHPIVGTWRVTEASVQTKGPREVIIRSDSSASWGQEHARWRLIRNGRVIMIAVGGEWETYDIRIRGNRLTLSGGDLQDPVTLTKTGPATPRPSGVPVPPDPDHDPPGP